MDILLKNNLTAHYGIPSCNQNIRADVNYGYFEIYDDTSLGLNISQVIGTGSVRYNNPHNKKVTIIDYDSFLTSLIASFQHGKKRCDIISYTDDNNYFLLNELKDRYPFNPLVLTTAVSQMLHTLSVIVPVPTIKSFIDRFNIKRCCYCNKQSTSPSMLTATTAFNRLGVISPPDGFHLSNTLIEAFGFELYEYTGVQTISLT